MATDKYIAGLIELQQIKLNTREKNDVPDKIVFKFIPNGRTFRFHTVCYGTSYKKRNNSEVWFRFKNELHKIFTSHFPSRFDLINGI